jgi:Fe-Mn family superoxide dismutase
MSDFTANRRLVFAAGLGLAASAAAAGPAAAQPAQFAFEPAPLPFDPAAIPELSERLLRSHYENNYQGAVRRLGAIAMEVAELDSAAPGYRFNGLKREELMAWNSMILHELYFAGIGTPNRPGAALAGALERDFGSHQAWRSQFTAMAKAQGGGSGWVLLTWSARDNRLVNTWAGDHTMGLAGGTPLLSIDMYEHAYHMDFGARAGDYVDAFMGAVNWSSADAAFARVAA